MNSDESICICIYITINLNFSSEKKIYIHIYARGAMIIQVGDILDDPKGCLRGVMIKTMDRGIVVRKFVLQSRYYVHFLANTLRKGMNPLSSKLWVK